MVQEDKPREKLYNDGGSLVGLYNRNKNFTSTNTYADYLDVDCRGIRSSVITLFNTDSSNAVVYEIWATAEPYVNHTAMTGTDNTDYDNGWVQIKAETTLAASAAPTIETLDNPYTRLVVRVKSSVADSHGTVSIYHRGEN